MDGKRGFIDSSGRIVAPPKFEFARGYSDQLALVWSGTSSEMTDKTPDSWGYVDMQGNMQLRPKYDDGRPFCAHCDRAPQLW